MCIRDSCVGAVLPVPKTLSRVVDEQRPVMAFILHADEILPSGAAGHGIVVELRPEAAADLAWQTPVVHANAHARFVIQPVIHHDQALARPILHARALPVSYTHLSSLFIVQFPFSHGISQI